MPTLILSQRFTADSNTLWHAAIQAGWDVERVRGYRCPAGVTDPVLYGETLFADALLETLELHLIEPGHPWLPEVPERYRLRAVRLTTLDQAAGLQGTWFVKAPDEKLFRAALFSDGELAEATRGLPPTTPLLVSEPVRFKVEYRLFILEREIATMSLYLRDGELPANLEGPHHELAEARDFAQALLADPEVRVPPAVVIDVGRLDNGRWAVVEANPAWGSGLLACDPQAVLKVLQRASRTRATITSDDRPWLRGE